MTACFHVSSVVCENCAPRQLRDSQIVVEGRKSLCDWCKTTSLVMEVQGKDMARLDLRLKHALVERDAAVARAEKAEAMCSALAEALDSLLAKADVRDAEAESVLVAYRKARGEP